MPSGCFLIVYDESTEKKIHISHSRDESSAVNLGTNELLKLRMQHTDKRFVTLKNIAQTKKQAYSYKTIVTPKSRRKQELTVFGGLILSVNKDPDSFQDNLMIFVKSLTEFLSKPEEELLQLMKDNFTKYFTEQYDLDLSEFEDKLKKQIKILNQKGEFEKASKLLDKLKIIPKQLMVVHKIAFASFNSKNYKTAIENFTKAKGFATKLGEKSLILMYDEKIQIAKKIPKLLNQQKESIETALQSLREDNFKKAQEFFLLASKISNDLADTKKFEEYSAKANALREYIKIDKKFNPAKYK